MKKLGILMSKEMEAEITWCAVIALWFQICQKTEFLLIVIHEKNKENYLKEFYQIAYESI